MEKALELLLPNFHKILKVNINNGKYDIIKVKDGELPQSPRAKVHILAWVEEFIENYNVIEDDLESHRLVYNFKYMREYFKEHDTFSVRYKRKTQDNKFEWVQLLLHKTDEPDIIYLYVIDIDKYYHTELDYLINMNLLEITDEDTGFKNKDSFDKLINNFNNRKVGLVYIKYNNKEDILKSIDYIKNNFVCGSFKVSDNEIFIICNDFSRQRFHEKYHNLVNELQINNIQCEIGKLWKEKYESLLKLVDMVKEQTWNIAYEKEEEKK